MAGAGHSVREAGGADAGGTRAGADQAGDLVDVGEPAAHVCAGVTAEDADHAGGYSGGDTVRRRSTAGVTLIEVLIAVTLLSLLVVGMAIAMRVGFNAFAKTNAKLMDNRRVAGAQRALEQELEGMVPLVLPCLGAGPERVGEKFAFFQGDT